jgi:S1 RNA binding domain protein
VEATDLHPRIVRAAYVGLTSRFGLAHTWRASGCLGSTQDRGEGAGEIADIEVGAVIKGTVARIENYGAFLQLEDGRMGLVHISEIDRNYVKDVREHLREGDTVEAKVVAIKDDGKIDLSIKSLQDPAPPRPRRGSDPQFEQMLKKFMRQSEERQVDYRRATEHKRK